VTLQETIVSYLESKGWYFDWDHVLAVWGEDDDDEAELRAAPEVTRVYAGWTVPQWGEYWTSPREGDGAPKRRRYESLRDALWLQLLREEEPGKFGTFFDDTAAYARKTR